MINVGGKLLDLSSPVVMSIINVNPDSFYAGSRKEGEDEIRKAVAQAIADGASIIDIGGYSTRPGADEVSEEDESNRVLRALEAIREDFPNVFVSVDTFRSGVVTDAVERFGPVIVNDVTAGFGDRDMIEIVAEMSLPYVAMHMRGTPKTMDSMNRYGDMIEDILKYFRERLEKMSKAGMKDVIIDPGFGFAKDTVQNFELLRRLNELSVLGKPVLGGLSRKTMIWKTLDITPDEALNGTTALNWELLKQGAAILRVHDTREAVETIELYKNYNG